jgi:hypothetical protein
MWNAAERLSSIFSMADRLIPSSLLEAESARLMLMIIMVGSTIGVVSGFVHYCGGGYCEPVLRPSQWCPSQEPSCCSTKPSG